MRETLRDPIETALDEAGDVVDAQVVRLRDIGDQLADENLPALSAAVAGVAGGVEGLARGLTPSTPTVCSTPGRRRRERRGPWIFMAGGAVLGFAVWATLRRGAPDEEEPRRRADGGRRRGVAPSEQAAQQAAEPAHESRQQSEDARQQAADGS